MILMVDLLERCGPSLPALVISSRTACLLLSLTAGVAAAADLKGQDVPPLVTWEDINRPAPNHDARLFYGPDSLTFGDLRLPPAVERPPLVIVIHGGCWRAENDLVHASHLSAALRDAGIATWTLEYRRVGNPGGGWPGTFRDVIAGANYVLDLAQTYNLDTNRVVLLGHSAGGHLALWMAAHAARRGDETDFPAIRIPIKSVISLAGITDLETFSEGTAYCNASVPPLMGGSPQQVPERYRQASPVQMRGPAVPVLLVHGAKDPYVPIAQLERYREAARAFDQPPSVRVLEDAGHFDLIAPFSPIGRDVVRLIDSVLRSNRVPQ
jgi:acetyl esterase/lipase